MKEENYKIIFDRLQKHALGKSDADVARALGVSPQALSAFKKQGKFPPDLLIKYCFSHQLSLDWLFYGEEQYDQSSVVCEKLPMYKLGDPDISEIVTILEHDLPEVKNIILKILRGRKQFKEGIKAIQTMNDMKEEET